MKLIVFSITGEAHRASLVNLLRIIADYVIMQENG